MERNLIKKGKVRDIYQVEDDVLELVQTDRQSAFDRHICHIPGKGKVLTEVSAHWFKEIEKRGIVKTHYISHQGNCMRVKKCEVIPVEVVVRGIITGSTSTSLWTHYQAGKRTYAGVTFPDGLVKNQILSHPVVTPTTKGEVDEPISPSEIVERGILTSDQWNTIERIALKLFGLGSSYLSERGLILADTKYEFGYDSDGALCLIDEVHTCDSSRIWEASSYFSRFKYGQEPEKFDKDLIRSYLLTLCNPYGGEPLPPIPEELIWKASRAYRDFGLRVTKTLKPKTSQLMKGLKEAATLDHGMHTYPVSSKDLLGICHRTLSSLSTHWTGECQKQLRDKALDDLSSTDEGTVLKAIGTLLYFCRSSD